MFSQLEQANTLGNQINRNISQYFFFNYLFWCLRYLLKNSSNALYYLNRKGANLVISLC